MASTYTTNFGIEEMASGDQAGAWGTTTNFNFDIMDRIASYKSVTISATSHTLTVREASPDTGTSNVQDGMFRVIKFADGGDIGGNCTVTVAPNTTTAWFIFENALSASRTIDISQGSGANVTIQNGKNVAVYCDGAGAGAAVANALSDLQIATLECTGAAALDGNATVGGTLGVTGATTLSSTLGVTSGTTLSSTLAVTSTITGSAGATLAKEDSGTNTVLTPLTLQRTSSATPAAGIGTGLAFVTETTAGNNETGVTLNAVTTDISAASEDFDLTFNLMAAGAAVAEKMRLESTGNLGIGVTDPSVQLHIAKSSIADIGTLTSSATITPDFAANQNFTVTLAHNAELANPSNVVAGQTGSIFVVQDGTGSRTMSYGSNWEFPGGTAPTLTTTASALDRIDYVVRSATSIQAVATLAYA